MPELPTGTVTFLFTDIEGSTRLWEEHADAMKGALARHDEVLRASVESHGGHVVKTTGDGIHAAFATAHEAVDAAVDGQRALEAESWEPVLLRVRMGIHTGEAEQRDGDYYGGALNRAARLMASAHGGQIVVSRATEELARDSLPDGVALRDLGEHRLRDLARPERVHEIRLADDATEFPPLRSLDVYPGNLPLQLTSFVGRDRDLDGVAAALRDHRLVTLTGVGGVGKTRLSLQVAADVLPEFPDGAWLCELAAASDPTSMVDIVAATLGVVPKPGAAIEAGIVEFVRGKQLLIVLDNCEHLLDPAARLVEDVLLQCPDVRVLATSREVLAVPGEQVWGLRSLSTADVDGTPEALMASDACRLFVERARGVKSGFEIDNTNAAAIAEICRRLDGIPLAIELAAARVLAMHPTDISRLLDERFRLLSGGRRTAVERHQTLRATVDWSYSMLSETERLVFDRLGVFPASFGAGAATEIVGGDGVEAWDVVDALASLVAKSMLATDDASADETRYQMLETLRQYAREQLDEVGDADQWRRRHAVYFTDQAERLGRQLTAADELPARHAILTELDNYRSAVNWGFDANEPDDVQLAVRIVTGLALLATAARSSGVPVWAERAAAHLDHADAGQRLVINGAASFGAQHRGDIAAARRFAEAAVRERVDVDAPARVLGPGGLAAATMYENPQRSLEILADSIGPFTEVGDTYGVGTLHALAAIFASFGGDFERAQMEADVGLAQARALRNPSLLVTALYGFAVAYSYDDPAASVAALEESLERTAGGASDIVVDPVHQLMARLKARAGDRQGALEALRQGIEHAVADGNRVQVTGIVTDAIEVLGGVGYHDVGAVLAGAVRGPLSEMNVAVAGREQEARDAAVEQVRAAVGEEQFEAAARRGAAMSIEEVAEYVQHELDRILGELEDG